MNIKSLYIWSAYNCAQHRVSAHEVLTAIISTTTILTALQMTSVENAHLRETSANIKELNYNKDRKARVSVYDKKTFFKIKGNG